MLCAGVVRYALGCLCSLNLDAAQKKYKTTSTATAAGSRGAFRVLDCELYLGAFARTIE